MFLSILVIVALWSFEGWSTTVNEDGEDILTRPFPQRSKMHLIISMACAASGFGLISVLWLHVGAVAASATLNLVYKVSVKTGVGAVAMTLGWVSVCLQILVCAMAQVMIWSVEVLHRLTDED